jgi:site-specific DNA recombinase
VAYLATVDGETGPSIAEQKAELYAAAVERSWRIVEVVVDSPGHQGRSTLRPGIRSLLAGVRLGVVRCVVATSVSRLARSADELVTVWATLGAADQLRLILTTDGVDTAQPGSRAALDGVVSMLTDSMSARASNERLRALAGDAKRTSTRVYGLDETWTKIVDDEAAVVREAAQRVLDGEPLRSIVDDFERRAVPTPSGRGTWTQPGLRALLVNPRMWGWRAYRGEPIAPGTWPSIIDQQTGERLVRRLSGSRQRQAPDVDDLLVGLLHCSACGTAMTVRSSSRRRYACPNPPAGCGAVGIDARGLELLIVETAFDEIAHGSRLDRLAAAAFEVWGDEESIVRRLAEHYRRRALLAGRITASEIDAAEAERIITELDDERVHIDRALGVVRLTRFPLERRAEPDFLRGLADLSASRTGSLVRLLVERIDIAPADVGRRFDPDRVTISWRS